MAHGRVIYGNPPRYFLDGKEVPFAVFDAAFEKHDVTKANAGTLVESSKAWPRKSDAFGVGKKQKKQMEEICKKKGVPTEYVPDGAGGYSALIRNNAHQRDLLKAFGMHNRDGGYGQVTG